MCVSGPMWPSAAMNAKFPTYAAVATAHPAMSYPLSEPMATAMGSMTTSAGSSRAARRL